MAQVCHPFDKLRTDFEAFFAEKSTVTVSGHQISGWISRSFVAANEQTPFDTLRYSGCLFISVSVILFSRIMDYSKCYGRVSPVNHQSPQETAKLFFGQLLRLYDERN